MTVRWEKMDAKISKKQLAKIAKINQAKMKMKAALILQFARQNANILQDFFNTLTVEFLFPTIYLS